MSNPTWGRVLICGGVDWPNLGARTKSNNDDAPPDLLSPHILRSLAPLPITAVYSSHSSSYFICITTSGQAFGFGRLLPISQANYTPENAPQLLQVEDRIVHAAVGRTHAILVGSKGHVWTWGTNVVGQCGHSASTTPILAPRLLPADSFPPDEKPVKAAAGITFSVIVTQSGRVYTFGSGEHGQLGNGKTGERIVTAGKTSFDVISHPLLVRELEGVKITQVSCGQQHAIALDSNGLVYVWGYNGYCRLGLGNQQDVLKPKVVPQFSNPENSTSSATLVVAGPSNSAVVDKQGMYYMAGKWKNTGEGSSGSPYSTFRFMQDIMGCKVTHVACGGVTHWALSREDDGGPMTIGWGQGAGNGELGLGEDMPKSMTKPGRQESLVGIEVLQIAAGQYTTVFLVQPNEKMSNLNRHPEDVEVAPECKICGVDEGEPLACDKCDSLYHLKCLSPPLTAVPEGEWFCQPCLQRPSAPIGPIPAQAPPGSNKAAAAPKRKKEKVVYEEDYDDDEDAEEDEDKSFGDEEESDDGAYGSRKRAKRRKA